jgi:hypothetical protein
VAVLSQVAGGATYSLALSGGQVVTGLIIVGLIVFLQPRMGSLDRMDYISIAIASFGVLVWIMSGNPLYGLLGALLADAAATVMGIRASLLKGTRDSVAFWVCCMGAAIAALLAAGVTSWLVMLAPLFSLVNAAANIMAVWYVRQQKIKGSQQLMPQTDAV